MFHLSLVTPGGKIFDGDIEYVSVPGTEGSLGVLSRHTPILALLKKGILTIKQNNEAKFFAIGAGILEVGSDHSALVLSNEALHSADESEAAEKLKAIAK